MMKKRIISLALALMMIVTTIPAPTFAADASEVTPKQHPMIGEMVAISPSASYYYHAPGGSYSIVNNLYFADCMEIVAVDETTSTIYYQLNAAPNFSWKADSLGNVVLYDGIWVKASDTIHLVYCKDCKEYNCGKDHSTTEPTTPSTPPTVEGGIGGYVTDSEGNIVLDANGNPLIVAVTGDLPEGATVVAIDHSAVAGSSNVGIYDIKVIDKDGNSWQPATGKTVKVMIPAPADCESTHVVHYMEDVEHIKATLDKQVAHVLDLNLFPKDNSILLGDAIAAYQLATDTDAQSVAFELFKNVSIENGFVSVDVNGFSVFQLQNSTYSVADNGFNNLDGKTVYVRPGELIELNVDLSWSKINVKEDANNIVDVITEGGPSLFDWSGSVYFRVSKDAQTGWSFTLEAGALWKRTVKFVVKTDIDYDNVYIGVLPHDYEGYPNELGLHSSYANITDYTYWLNSGAFGSKATYTTTPSTVLDRTGILHSGELSTDTAQTLYGIVDSTGELTAEYLTDTFNNEIASQILTKYCEVNGLNKSDYKLVVYVVKYETVGSNIGWYINCKAVRRDSYTLSYDYNAPDGFNPVDHIGTVKKPENQTVYQDDAENGVFEALVDCSKLMVMTRKVKVGNQEETYTATFIGWSTSPTDQTVEYPFGAQNQKITIEGNTTLYAVWELSDNVQYVEADVTIKKVVKDAKGNTVSIVGVPFTFTPDSNLQGLSYSIYNANGIRQSTGTLGASFVMQNGWYIVIEDVPNSGTAYTITESIPNEYTSGYATPSALSVLVNSDTNKTGFVNKNFENIVNTYTVTWKNHDDTVLETDTDVPYGDMPSYNGATPTKVATAQYTYTFTGWDKTISAVTGNVTYTAQFANTTNTYTITWVNEGGAVLETDTNVPYGENPKYNGTTPTKPADAQYTYTFAGWSPTVQQVKGNTTYTAIYSPALNSYTITFVDEDGSVLQSSNVDYGTTPTYTGKTPTKEADAQYTYTFDGWTTEIAPVTGEATYTVKYKGTLRSYTVTWKNHDGTVLETDHNVSFGTMPEYNGATPTKAADNTYTYSWRGWDKAVSSVTGDVTYTATFSKAYINYSVTYKANASTGADVIEGSLHYGVTYTLKGENTFTKEGYTFIGWNTSADGKGTAYAAGAKITISGNVTLYAQWRVNEVAVTYFTNGGTPIGTATVNYGANLTLATNTTKVGHSFKGWFTNEGLTGTAVSELTNVTQDTTVYAKWDINQYTITFVLGNGQENVIIMQDYNTVITAPDDPVWYGYDFLGWDTEIPTTMPAENITITAQWELALADLTVKVSGDRDADQSYVFAVYRGAGNNKTFVMNVVIPAGKTSVTIKDLPVDTYTVTPVSGWAWRLKTDDNGQVELNGNQTVEFKWTLIDSLIYWLNGYGYDKKGG